MTFDLVVGVLWTLSWLVALVVGIRHFNTVYQDWQAIVFYNVKDGRRIVALGNLRTMALLLVITIFNLIVGIQSLLTAYGLIHPTEISRIIAIVCLTIAAFCTTGIILGKRTDRNHWEEQHPQPTEYEDEQ